MTVQNNFTINLHESMGGLGLNSPPLDRQSDSLSIALRKCVLSNNYDVVEGVENAFGSFASRILKKNGCKLWFSGHRFYFICSMVF